MQLQDRMRLADLRMKYAFALDISPIEFAELLRLQAEEHMELHGTVVSQSSAPPACESH
jgi:hypothetical protein